MPIIDVEVVVDANATLSDVLAQSLADAIGRTLNSPASIASVTGRNPAAVHIEYAPAAAGRVSFGGKLVE